MKWVDILKVRSRVSKKAHAIAKNRYGLPMMKTQGCYLLIHDKDGKQLTGSTDHGFPMCGKDWSAIKDQIATRYPKAHTLHLSIIVSGAEGWRSYEAGNITHNCGQASERVHTY